MKTTLLFSACLLMAAASFAQNTVKNDQQSKTATNANADKSAVQAGSSTNTSSTASVQSDAVNTSEKKLRSDVKKGEKAISDEKKAASEKTKATETEVQNTASGNYAVSGEAKSEANLNAGKKGNKMDENSSSNSQASVSAPGTETTVKQVAKEGRSSVASTRAVAAQTSHGVKTKAGKALIKADKKVKTSGSTSNAKPASIRMDTRVRTTAAIRIK